MWSYNYMTVGPDELYHFKYIKRVKGPDGKWQYYYATKTQHEAIQKSLTLSQKSQKKGNQYTAEERKHRNKAAEYIDKGSKPFQKYLSTPEWRESMAAQETAHQKKYGDLARAEYTRARKLYQGNEQFTVRAQVKKRMDSGKAWFERIFGKKK